MVPGQYQKAAGEVYRQCLRCVMDTSDPDIRFDAEGHCNHCSTFLSDTIYKTYLGPETDKVLQALVAKIKKKGRGKAYDCVLGISGGADSCYAAYCCSNLGLRVLLVHVDNGWDTTTSVDNIRALCNGLGLDYVSRVLPWEDFKEIQVSHLRASVPEMESPTDIALLEELHKVAAEYGVSYIISGGNYITEGILPKSWHYNAKDKKFAKAIHAKFGRRSVKYFPSFDFLKEAYYKFWKGIKMVYLLNYLPFNKTKAIETLQTLGWKRYGEKHHESFYTRMVQAYILPKKFNIDYRKATLSTKICTGEITRAEALRRLAQATYDEATIASDINYVCKKLGLQPEEFEAMMQSQVLSYKDYPNDEFRLTVLYGAYSRLFAGQKRNNQKSMFS